MKAAYFLPDIENPFWKLVASGVEKSARREKIGFEFISSNHDEQIQIAQLEACAQKKPEIVFLSPVGMKKIAPTCNAILKTGIPIVAVDQNMGMDVTASVISGNMRGGAAAAMFLCDHLLHGGRVVHIQAEEDLENARLRRTSFINEIIRKGLSIVKTIQADSNRQKSYEQMKGFLTEGIPFNALFAENDAMALGAIQALKEKSFSPWPIIVGFDGVPEALNAIRNGDLEATIAQNPEALGEKAFEIALKILYKKPFEELTTIIPRLIARQDLS